MTTALVSGASRGLGRALAIDLARDHHVVGFARSTAVDGLPPQVDYLPGVDLSDATTWTPLDEHLVASDVLVNNAGMAHDGLLATQGEQRAAAVLDLNLGATLELTRRYVRARLRARRPGVIVSIGSIVGHRGYAGLVAYGAAKAGIDGMTRALARELGPKGFRVNAVAPGFFPSDLSAGLTERQEAQIVRRTPLGRLATVDDIVPVVRFLISDDARFITGQSIVVDGGITA